MESKGLRTEKKETQRKEKRLNRKHKGSFNGWKWFSLVLVGLILGTGIFIGSKILVTPTNTSLGADVSQADDPVFDVSLTKKQVNRLASYYLDNYLKNDKIKYEFKLDDEAILGGKFTFLGAKIPFTLSFTPYVLENGDIQLKAKTLAIGALPIPVSSVLNFVGNDFNLPQWVSLSTKEGIVTLHLRKFKIGNGMSVRAKHIDLDDNQIEFSVYLAK